MTQSSPKPRIGVYPGTFDPITKGHLHIIKRASRQVDKLVVGVAGNARKSPRFTLEERIEMVKTDCDNLPEKYCEIEVRAFDNLLVHFAQELNADCIFRGLRAISDFDYEFQMTGMNARLAPDIETVFLMAADKWQFVSASFVKEIHAMGGDVSEFVTPATMDRLNKAA
ncbi:MAG: pantetheine-phosphate adenylyltransferase [Micavibrio aeruginosavorus]|uniref:Phosphopantetheine adenylyltransferase n=1 Tax=Micavibrio aeruginosavorus TaxID=349221 RepID=A0A2W5N9A2_9BACT|nr:MAG: pantetheine-phosphate adenylyltransferase [Micavibrio aeruginosavorus]